MSTQVFPTLPGLTFPVTRTPIWNTQVQESMSNKELRLAYSTYPRYRWQVMVSVLRTDAAYLELQTLLGFYNSRQGQFDTFLYVDPYDNAVITQTIATGDGLTSALQLVRTLGGFTEPVLAPHTLSAVYLAGVSIPAAGYSAPTNGALTQTLLTSAGEAVGMSNVLGVHVKVATHGGAADGIANLLGIGTRDKAAATYYVRSTWVTNSGETLAGSETTLAVSVNNALNVAAPSSAPVGAIGWNVYVSNSITGGSGTETRQNDGTPIALGAAWVEPRTGLVTGAALPSSNTTGWVITGWGTSTPGILTFGSVVVNGIIVTADFTYYWPCRFLQDDVSFSLFLSGMYEVKQLAWESVKN